MASSLENEYIITNKQLLNLLKKADYYKTKKIYKKAVCIYLYVLENSIIYNSYEIVKKEYDAVDCINIKISKAYLYSVISECYIGLNDKKNASYYLTQAYARCNDEIFPKHFERKLLKLKSKIEKLVD